MPYDREKQWVESILEDLEPIRLKGAPKVSERWSGTLNIDDLKVEKKLGSGGFSDVWAVSRLDMPLNDTPDTNNGSGIPNVTSNRSSELGGRGGARHAVFAAKMLSIEDDTDSDKRGNKQTHEQKRGTDSHASNKGGTSSMSIGAKRPETPTQFAKNEARLVMSLRHKHVIKCYGAFQNEYYLVVFYEYGMGGDVDTLLCKRGRFTREEALSITSQLLDAVNYIHNNGIVHRDIKPENIYYKYDRRQFEDSEYDGSKSHEVESRDKYLVFLGDFGLAVKTENGKTSGLAGTLDYMAPEIIRAKNNNEYDAKVDIWSLGVITYRLMTGRVPHFDNNIIYLLGHRELQLPRSGIPAVFKPLVDYIEKHEQEIVAKRFENDPVQEFLMGCLTIDPNNRKADKGIIDSARLKCNDLGNGMKSLSLQDTNSERKGIGADFDPVGKWKVGAGPKATQAAQAIRQGRENSLKSNRAQTPVKDTSNRRGVVAKSTKAPEKKDFN